MHRLLACCALALTVGGAATAQAPSWTPVPDAPRGMTASVLAWPSGVQILARCSDRAFSLMFAAVHNGPATHAHFRLDREDWERVHWEPAGQNRLFFSKTPARMARRIGAGGTLELRFAPDDGPSVLYQLDLPSTGDALNAVLSDCGLPAVDPRDNLRMADDVDWIARPTGADFARYYPVRGRQGDTLMLCVVRRSGRLDDCEITYETPRGVDFGHATLALAPRFRLNSEQAAGLEGQLVSIPVGWRMQ